MDIILCATQRCGSTLILEDMRNTGRLGQPEEWFIPWDPAKTDVDWAANLDGVRRRATDETGVSAIKIMANQLDPVNRCLASFRPACDGVFAHVAQTMEGARWVQLLRRDVVAQAISRVMAMQTGVNHATARPEDAHFAGNLKRGYDPDYNARTAYDYTAILRQVTSITLETLSWQSFFEANGITPEVLVYEDVIADPEMGHLDLLARLAGVAGPLPRQPRKMVKIGNARNTEWRMRFLREAAASGFAPLA